MRKKKTEQGFEYLKDGYEERAVERWSRDLKRSPEQVLKSCEEAVTQAESTDAAATFTEVHTQCVTLLRGFCEMLIAQTARIPKPTSIFLGEEERKPAYAAICRLLGETETFRKNFGAATMEVMAIESLLSRCTRARNHATRILADVGAATRRVPVTDAFFSAHGMLRARLTAENENAMRVAEKSTALQGKVTAFYSDVLPNFCIRAEKAADMAHDGEACNPMVLIRLCGELREATENLVRQLEKY